MTRFSLAFMLGVWVTVAAYALGRWTRFPWIKPHHTIDKRYSCSDCGVHVAVIYDSDKRRCQNCHERAAKSWKKEKK